MYFISYVSILWSFIEPKKIIALIKFIYIVSFYWLIDWLTDCRMVVTTKYDFTINKLLIYRL